MSENIKTIENAFKIIELLHENENMGVSEISTLMSLPKTSSHRILKTLKNLKIVYQNEDETYSLGYTMYKYAAALNRDKLLINLSREAMRKFAEETGETINLGRLSDDEVVIIHSEEGDYYALQAILSINSPLYCSGMGKIFLSQFDDKKLKEYFDREHEERTINTITTFHEYLKVRQNILNKNVAFDNEEYEYGLSCISTGLFNEDGQLIAALSVSGPTSRLMSKDIHYLEDKLLKTSKIISEKLGVLK